MLLLTKVYRRSGKTSANRQLVAAQPYLVR
jgi:hypothetical protein